MIWMLDTNAVSDLIRGQVVLSKRVQSVPMSQLGISAITEAEILYGLAKRPSAKRLHIAVHELLLRLDVLPWTRKAAQCYGDLRADLEKLGKSLSSLDCLIAAHALSWGATLITRDKAFGNVQNLSIEDWTVLK
jgi:tRNA(fMet)-specific endonuclease VapC